MRSTEVTFEWRVITSHNCGEQLLVRIDERTAVSYVGGGHLHSYVLGASISRVTMQYGTYMPQALVSLTWRLTRVDRC